MWTPGAPGKLSAGVVIRARNEARYIGETLAAILDPEGLEPCQVVVVDSGSTDGTLTIVRGLLVRLIEIRPEEFTYGTHSRSVPPSARQASWTPLSAHSTPVGPDWLRCLLEPFSNLNCRRHAARPARQRPGSTLITHGYDLYSDEDGCKAV